MRVTDDEANTLNRVTAYRPRGRSISDSLFHINPDGTRDVNVSTIHCITQLLHLYWLILHHMLGI